MPGENVNGFSSRGGAKMSGRGGSARVSNRIVASVSPSQAHFDAACADVDVAIVKIANDYLISPDDLRSKYVLSTLVVRAPNVQPERPIQTQIQPVMDSSDVVLPVIEPQAPSAMTLLPPVSLPPLPAPLLPVVAQSTVEPVKKKQYSCDLEAVLEGEGVSDCDEEEEELPAKSKDLSLQKGSALYRTPVENVAKLTREPATQYKRPPDPSPDGWTEVYITRIDGANAIYFRPVDANPPETYELTYDQLLNASEPLPPELTKVGAPCMLVAHLTDQCSLGWARGIIESFGADGSPRVHLVDYGQLAGPVELYELKPVPQTLAQRPPICYMGALDVSIGIMQTLDELKSSGRQGLAQVLGFTECSPFKCAMQFKKRTNRFEQPVQITDLRVDGLKLKTLCDTKARDCLGVVPPPPRVLQNSNNASSPRSFFGFGQNMPPTVSKSKHTPISDDDRDETLSIVELTETQKTRVEGWLQNMGAPAEMDDSVQSNDTFPGSSLRAQKPQKENWDK